MAEKTEKATPKKLRDARKKGQVSKSQDFPAAFTFVVSIAVTLGSAGYLYQTLAGYLVATFRLIKTDVDLQNTAPGFLTQALMIILTTSLPILFITCAVGLLISIII